MNLKQPPIFDAERFDVFQGCRVARISGMAKDRWRDQGGRILPFGRKPPGNLDVFSRIRNSRCRKVNYPLGQYRPHTTGPDGGSHLIFKKISITAGGRSGKQHFDTSQQGALPHIMRINVVAFSRKDMLV